VAQPYAAPLGAVVDAGLAAVRALGAASALVLMADLPGLEPDEVGALLSRLRGAEVVIAPDERGDGTNALGIRFTGPIADPDALEHTAFGNPDSFVRHCTWARRTGRRLEVLRRPGLELDVDLPEDLARMGAWMPARVPEHRVSG
jgi:2-phospho-L-lactate guanylyltransferase